MAVLYFVDGKQVPASELTADLNQRSWYVRRALSEGQTETIGSFESATRKNLVDAILFTSRQRPDEAYLLSDTSQPPPTIPAGLKIRRKRRGRSGAG